MNERGLAEQFPDIDMDLWHRSDHDIMRELTASRAALSELSRRIYLQRMNTNLSWLDKWQEMADSTRPELSGGLSPGEGR